jgi:hypothetical protein
MIGLKFDQEIDIALTAKGLVSAQTQTPIAF